MTAEARRNRQPELKLDRKWSSFRDIIEAILEGKGYTSYDGKGNPDEYVIGLDHAEVFLNPEEERYEFPSVLLRPKLKQIVYRDSSGDVVVHKVESVLADGRWVRIQGQREIAGKFVPYVFSLCRLGRTDIGQLIEGQSVTAA